MFLDVTRAEIKQIKQQQLQLTPINEKTSGKLVKLSVLLFIINIFLNDQNWHSIVKRIYYLRYILFKRNTREGQLKSAVKQEPMNKQSKTAKNISRERNTPKKSGKLYIVNK